MAKKKATTKKQKKKPDAATKNLENFALNPKEEGMSRRERWPATPNAAGKPGWGNR